jgi:hypothetical protein
VNKLPYCYCNKGYSGASCTKDSSSSSSSSNSSYDGYSVQVTLLVLLVLVTVILVGVIGYMIYKVTNLRKEHATDYVQLSGGGIAGAEMVRSKNSNRFAF